MQFANTAVQRQMFIWEPVIPEMSKNTQMGHVDVGALQNIGYKGFVTCMCVHYFLCGEEF